MSDHDTTSASRGPPERLGPYRVLQVLGEGAMGIVYEAEETSPVRRRVALKVIKAGLRSREVIARFDAERHALAVMDHAGIAKVLGAGELESGEPYVAMELVKGLPLTEYCDVEKLPVRQRLGLFVEVCQAVQHAHQKGVIHRDLKPSNILVALHDGKAQPKIIDFGIAKALGVSLTELTLVTRWGQAMGTPAYMSPEQAESSGLDVDTRADIYSLGVLLYEMLVGRLPVDPETVGLNVFLARLASRDSTPLTPSARVRTLGGDEPSIARARRTDPARLRGELKGDLDWIVMKALDPDRNRRYETASALAADIERHLADQPVLARSPNAAYRLRKFVRRHRTGVVTAAIAVAVVVSSAVVATVGFVRATKAEQRAQRNAAEAQAVTAFLTDLFRVSDPNDPRNRSRTPRELLDRGNAITAREILDSGTARIRSELSTQPLLQGQLMQTMGTVHQGLGLYGSAQLLLEDALRIRERILGPDDSAVAGNLVALGGLLSIRGDQAQAERDFQRALTIREQARHADDAGISQILNGLASVRIRQGRAAAAESLYHRIIAIDTRLLGDTNPKVAREVRTLAAVYQIQKRYAEAESLLRHTLAIEVPVLGENHRDVAATLINLGAVYWSLGRYADALPLYERALAIDEKLLGPDHPEVAFALNNLAETYWKLHRFAEAEPLFRRSLAIKEKVLTAGNPAIATTLNGLAGLLRDEQRYREAEPLYRRALDIREKAFGPGNSFVNETLTDWAILMRRSGRASEAAALEARAAKAR